METKYIMNYNWVAPNGAKPKMTTVFWAKNPVHAKNLAKKIYDQGVADAKTNPQKYGEFQGYGYSEILPRETR